MSRADWTASAAWIYHEFMQFAPFSWGNSRTATALIDQLSTQTRFEVTWSGQTLEHVRQQAHGHPDELAKLTAAIDGCTREFQPHIWTDQQAEEASAAVEQAQQAPELLTTVAAEETMEPVESAEPEPEYEY
jgi:fido (protein-threonine AMPylation protein)